MVVDTIANHRVVAGVVSRRECGKVVVAVVTFRDPTHSEYQQGYNDGYRDARDDIAEEGLDIFDLPWWVWSTSLLGIGWTFVALVWAVTRIA